MKKFNFSEEQIQRLNKDNIDGHYAYKLDIQNYFNSINVDKLLPMLKTILRDDDRLFALLENILSKGGKDRCKELVFLYVGAEVISQAR